MSIIRIQGESEKRRGIFYQLDSNDQPIGVGGMGQVFKGLCINERNGHTRPVAIKFMFDDLPPHAIERARREASIQLRNDNLVEMLGFIEIAEKTPLGDVKMHYHVVSELLTGVSLSDLMEGKTTDRDGNSVPFAEKLLADYKNDSEHFARTIVINVLSGLMALHDAGYIHRDIDPSNIMVTTDGHIKLIDFGIPDGHRPYRAHDNDAGADVYMPYDCTLQPGEIAKVPLGFGIEVPDGYAGYVFPRSSMAVKGLVCELPPVDSGYRGEIHAIISNVSREPHTIQKDTRIGQLVITPVVIADFVSERNKARGTGAFGSTGE